MSPNHAQIIHARSDQICKTSHDPQRPVRVPADRCPAAERAGHLAVRRHRRPSSTARAATTRSSPRCGTPRRRRARRRPSRGSPARPRPPAADAPRPAGSAPAAAAPGHTFSAVALVDETSCDGTLASDDAGLPPRYRGHHQHTGATASAAEESTRLSKHPAHACPYTLLAQRTGSQAATRTALT